MALRGGGRQRTGLARRGVRGGRVPANRALDDITRAGVNGPIRLDVELQNCEIRKMSEIERWANRWRAVADERRLRLLRLCADGPATVSALATATGDSEPNVSRQLKQLATAGLDSAGQVELLR